MYVKCAYFIKGYIKHPTAYQNVCFIFVCSFYQSDIKSSWGQHTKQDYLGFSNRGLEVRRETPANLQPLQKNIYSPAGWLQLSTQACSCQQKILTCTHSQFPVCVTLFTVQLPLSEYLASVFRQVGAFHTNYRQSVTKAIARMFSVHYCVLLSTSFTIFTKQQ